jgi:nucleoside-diphosphate-sugar epimerase
MSIIEKECKELVKKINFKELKNKSILVTGASGLIGVYLIGCLNEIKDSLNISITAWVKNDIDKEFKDIFKNCNIIQEDITNIDSFKTIQNYDVIIHAAGYGQPGKFMDNKIKTITLNTLSTIKLFEKLNKNGKFLFVSTSELYSGIDCELVTENQIGTTNTNHPRSCYIEGKRCGESICHSYVYENFDIKIARLSLAYGPGTKKNDHRVLNSLIQKGILNDKIELMDGGDAIRTYCYITDVIEMFWNILLFGKEIVYNVGGFSKITILDLAKLIGDKLEKNVIVPEIKNELIGNPKVVNISLEKYLKEFKKTDFVSLETGIDNTINWQKKLYIL